MSNQQWIDIGVNLTNQRFDKDRENVINDAIAHGVIQQIVTGTNLSESQQAYQLTQNHPEYLYSTAGCHPHDAKHFSDEALSDLRDLLEHSSVVAVGECGLDFNRNFSPPKCQVKVFEQQLELAVEVQKPLFLHERDAFEQQYEMLQSFWPKVKGAVVHCFTGNEKQLTAYLELGCSIGITGWVCDERRGKPLKDIIHLIPDDRLMLETDAPYLTPRSLKPKPKSSRNLPQYLPHIAATVAEVRKTDLQSLSEQCLVNTQQFFGLSERN
jgi:TatD DNase family protein